GAALVLCLCHVLPLSAAEPDAAAALLRQAGVQGGFIVHLGCGKGRLTAALRAGERFTVHGLAATAADAAATRAYLQQRGLYGPVSVEHFDATALPYVDNLVNLVAVEPGGRVPMAEVMRVLAPGGVACVRDGDGWKTTVKPRPADTDEWSHYLHDAGNNAVAADRVVGPPRRLQWMAPPLWLRRHETASGIQAQVAAGGRLFYIFDEGLIGITDERLPARWAIVCRDAFNGRLLWKRPLPGWGWRQWAKSRFDGKDWTVLRAARVSAPAEVQRRLVADGDRLYATMGFRAPVSIFHAATGEPLATIEGTAPTLEILASDGIVLAHVRETPSPTDKRRGKKPQAPSTLVAAKGATGHVLWRAPMDGTVRPYFTAIDQGHVFCLVGKTLVCLDLKTGKPQWKAATKFGGPRTLVASSGVALLLGGATLECFDAADGKRLWGHNVPKRSGGEVPDLFVVDGLVWPGMIPVDSKLNPTGKSALALALAFDLRTGEEKKRIVVANFRSPEHHHRCYRNKATTRYIISGMEGAEFLDLQADGHSQNNWLRGACKEGIMPCHGMLYVPPDQCFCQPGSKLLGYTAVVPDPPTPIPAVPDAQRLHKGPAYGKVAASAQSPADWPTLRHDAARHGSTPAQVAAQVAPAWRVKLGGRLTAPVVAGGRLLVAEIDAHTVHALGAATGKPQWRFVAGGRIDSPPTLHGGLVLFGSADGRVYCLRATDGALVWRFLAAPADRRIGHFDQIESTWPVSGSVLVRDGVAYVAAGRSTYLDGGIRLYGLDPATGRIVHQGLLEGPHPNIAGKRDVAFYITGANADVLAAEGDRIFMRQKALTPQLQEVKPAVLSSKGEADVGLHVFSTSGLLDGSWYNRTFWMYSKRWPGFQLANQAPKAGQLLVVDAQATYAVKVFYHRNVHSTMFFPGTKGYLLFADKNATEPQIVGEKGARPPLRWLPQSDYSRGRSGDRRKLESEAFGLDKMIGYTRADPPLWTLWLPVRIRAMVKTADVLFVAGPPDEYDPKDPHAAFEGRRGAVLVAVSPADGKKLGELKLDVPPEFDGMIAAQGRLFLSLRDGSIACLAGRGTP
ncbi:MAG: PQQ-binding-like beta-propeller repeat protein, partial [Candidatus Brocadiae bacterium]|nr:PQQ-binding-like beta-propeller repeat protein [Candidatus Brocadiia bacterium]